jgi:transposase
MKRKVNHYTDKFKLKVVKEYVETDISQEALKRKYGIGGNNCIPNWMRKFGMKTPNEEQIKLQRIMSEEQGKTKREVELEAKVRELEKSLDYERLRTLALDTMIDVAERDLRITIRKKSGARQ